MSRTLIAAILLILVAPLIAETEEDAQAVKARKAGWAADRVHERLAHFSKITNIDFAALDMDAPLGELTTNGHQQSLAEFLKRAGRRTLRETMTDYDSTVQSVELVGTPDSVAARMGEVMAEVADGLVPALQRRGLVRRRYEHPTFRENLLAF